MTTDAVAVSKARKILKRTLVGSSLIAAVALLLWWNETTHHGQPLFWTATVVLLATVFEVSRMGALSRWRLLVPLLSGACACILLAHVNIGLHGQLEFTRANVEAALPLVALWMSMSICSFLYIVKRVTRSTSIATLAASTLAIGLIAWLWLTAPEELAMRTRTVVIVLIAVYFATAFFLREPDGVVRAFVPALLGIWIVPPLLLVWSIWAQWGTRGLVALLVLSKFGDTCGYYVGSTIGKTHPFPKISPGKTTAGCVGSFVGVTAMSGVLWAVHVLPDGRFGLWGALAAGATLNIAAQAGDLLKSWTKRRAGVKDSSTIFGPAGGLLDQVDSLLLTVPMSLATWPFLFA
jgi:phosphatidate cytidylyltransferase